MADGKAKNMAGYTKSDELCNLSSPPKPTRMIKMDSKITSDRKEAIDNTSSLSALAGEVAVAQKSQVLRLDKRLEFLGKLQAEYRDVLRTRDDVEKHVKAVMRKSNVLQDDILIRQRNCETLKRDNDLLVSEIEVLKGDMDEEETEIAEEKCSYKVYREKMFKHKELSNLVEISDKNAEDIAKKAKHYENLMEETKKIQESNDISRLMSGEIREILMAEIFTLEESISEIKENLKERNQNFEKEKQDELKNDIENLHKKHHAQITWTRKQLQETMARNEHWREQAQQKDTEIQEIRRKIDEI